MDIFNKKIVIATHYLVYGAPQALREYLMMQRVGKLIFIAHPLQIDGTKSYIEIIKDGVVLNKKDSKFRTKIFLLNYFSEVFLTLKWFFLQKEKFDLWIGVDLLNTFSGIILRKLGKVGKVIYYTIDYVPERFSNKVLNNIYHWLDKFCLRNADETWNVSYRITEGREKIRGLKQSIYNKQKVVPIGVWFNMAKRLPFEKIKKHQLFFVGNLSETQGVQMVLEAMPEIIKEIPDFHFLIVGGGDYGNVLKSKTKELNLENHTTFTGWIKDRKKLDEIIADSALAIAMYVKIKDCISYYADPTKLKDYLSAGLPVLLTDVPHNAYDIEKNKCGVIINYDKDSIRQTVVGLMKDEKKLKEYRENAVNYVKQFDWSLIFEPNLERVLL